MPVIVIPGEFPSLNQYINECRYSPYAGNQLKAESMERAEWWIKQAHEPIPAKFPVEVRLRCYEKDKRRDVDGVVSMALKIVLDALQKTGHLPNDSQRYVSQAYGLVFKDKAYPRIQIEIVEGSKQ